MQILVFLGALLSQTLSAAWPQWAMSALGFALIFVVFRRSFAKRKIQEKPFTKKQFLYEILFSYLTLSFGILIGNSIEYLVDHNYATISEAPVDAAVFAQIVWQFVLYFFLFDAYFYFLHRLMHSDYLYWIHKHHHRSVTPNPLTSFSFHPIEGLITGGFVVLMVFLFDLHLYSIIAVNAYGVINSVIVHSGYEWYPSWWNNGAGKYYITTTYHDMHHSTYHYNFGAFTTLWDRLLGTNHPDYEATFARIHRPTGQLSFE